MDEIVASRQVAVDDPLQEMLIMIARQNLDILVRALRHLAAKWAGARYPLTVGPCTLIDLRSR